ncbi:Uncharacterized membrane protein, YraQ family [Olavius algarvensis Delta 1 endosymbiont]|nr:Uncharacterized membrane protein, YraQ family [Olavius algarvensis Delta 1 endosymbiont]
MILDEMLKIGNFIFDSFLHIWPYLVVTIPLAVAIQMSGASKYIKRAFAAKPFTAIVLATVVGAFSPFCSCGVIPVIASLLISGVPLAPVMSFWIASPSMDPEIFFLSVGMIGWNLAVWRLVATLILSFAAGLITHVVMANGWLGQPILRSRKSTPVQGTFELIKKGWNQAKDRFSKPGTRDARQPAGQIGSPSETLLQLAPALQSTRLAPAVAATANCGSCAPGPTLVTLQPVQPGATISGAPDTDCCGSQPAERSCCDSQPAASSCYDSSASFKSRLLKETLSATWMVGKFMALAFVLEALITFYVPASWISNTLGAQSPLAIFSAALLGVPAYTTSLTALPMISGLLNQGMNPAAAIAFLIAGPITTLPAMAAVWPLVVHRVFVMYVSFALVGAVLTGICYSLMSSF